MIEKIECPEENLEELILYAEQIPAYRFILGEPDPEKVDKKTIEHYHKGKLYEKQFEDEKNGSREFMVSLRAHVGICKKCSERINELRGKYRVMKLEQLENLTKQEKDNLKYFDLLD